MTEEIGPVQLVAIGFPPDAEFEGRIIDLTSEDWQGATSCVATHGFFEWRCFRTDAQAKIFIRQEDDAAATGGQAAAQVSVCSEYAVFYTGYARGGKGFSYRVAVTNWRNLPAKNQISSVLPPSDCEVHLADFNLGGGPHAGICKGCEVKDLRGIDHNLPAGRNWDDRANSFILIKK